MDSIKKRAIEAAEWLQSMPNQFDALRKYQRELHDALQQISVVVPAPDLRRYGVLGVGSVGHLAKEIWLGSYRIHPCRGFRHRSFLAFSRAVRCNQEHPPFEICRFNEDGKMIQVHEPMPFGQLGERGLRAYLASFFESDPIDGVQVSRTWEPIEEHSDCEMCRRQ